MSKKVVRKRSKSGHREGQSKSEKPHQDSPVKLWIKANWKTVTILAGIFILAFALRSALAYPYMYEGNQPSLSGNDPYYHMRVVDHIISTHHHLLNDDALNYPIGGANPRPPLFDWGLTLLAFAFTPFFKSTYEAAWYIAPFYSVIWASLTVIPIYLIGKEMFGRNVGLLAAFFIATSPAHMERVLLGFFDHDSYVLFFMLMAFYFLLMALKKTGSRIWVKDYGSLRSIVEGLEDWFTNSKEPLGYAVLSGVSMAAVGLAWKGASYIFAIIFLYFIFEILMDNILKREGLGVTMVTFTAMFVGLLLILPYYISTNRLSYMDAPIILFVGMVVFSLIFVPTRDKPWIMVISGFIGIVTVGLLILYYGFPDLWYTLSTGEGYFVHSKLVSTIAEAQPGDFSRMTFSFGLLNYYLALFGFIWAIYEFSKDFKTDRVFLVIWGAVMIYMALATVRFTFDATPIFSLFSAWMTVKIVEKFDPKWRFIPVGAAVLLVAFVSWYYAVKMEDDYKLLMWSLVSGFLAVVTIYILIFVLELKVWNKKDEKVRYLVTTLTLAFFLILPNVWFAVDAGIPYEGKSDYDPEGKLLGAYGFGKTSDYWVSAYDWMAQQDRGKPLDERPAFISWWDYGFWTVYLGEHPTVADNFQWGYQMAGSFITAQNETQGIALFIVRLTENNYNDPAIKDIFVKYYGEDNYTKYVNIMSIEEKSDADQSKFIKDVTSHPELYGPYDNLKIKNAKYAQARYFLTSRSDEDTLVNLLHDIEVTTKHSIRYFAIDYRLFPFSAQNTGIFYAPVKLSDHKVDYYLDYLAFAQINYGTQQNPKWQDVGHPLDQQELKDYAKKYQGWLRVTGYELRYKQEFFNTMLYKCYIGYNGGDIGLFDKDGYPDQGIPGLTDSREDTKADQLPPMQGWMMKHFRLVYRTTYWNPHNRSELDKNSKFYNKEYEKDWKPMNYEEAVKKQQKDGGVISSGLRAGVQMLKYYDGARFTGVLRTEDGQPIPGARVTVQDKYGIPHQSVRTDDNGSYSLILPFGDVKIIASKGGFEEGKNANYAKLAQVEKDILNTTELTISDDQAMRVEGSGWNIHQDMIVKSANVTGKVFWDDNNDGKFSADKDMPLQNINIVASTKDYGKNITYNITSGSNGTYNFQNLIPASYTLTAYVKNRNITSPETVELKAGDSKTDQNIPVKTSTVTFSLKLPNGTAVDGINVGLMDKTSGINYTAVSDKDGNVQFLHVIQGDYSVYINDDRFMNVNMEKSLTEGEDVNDNITLIPAVKLDGHMWVDYDANGQYSGDFEALPGAVATFICHNDNLTYYTTADSNGYYSIRLPVGLKDKDSFATYDVTVDWVSEGDYYTGAYTLPISNLVEKPYNNFLDAYIYGNGTRTGVDDTLELRASRAYMVNGTVKNKWNVSVPNVVIYLKNAEQVESINPDLVPAYIMNVNNKGEFRSYVPEGKYYVTAEHNGLEGFEGTLQTVNIVPGRNTLNISIKALNQIKGYAYWDLDGSGTYTGQFVHGNKTYNEGQGGVIVTASNEYGKVATVTTTTGEFTLNVPNGKYDIKATDPNGHFRDVYIGSVEVSENRSNIVNITLDPIPVKLSGTLYADWNLNGMTDGNEIAVGVKLNIVALDPGREDYTVTTGLDGSYNINIIPGQYEIGVNYTVPGHYHYKLNKTIDIGFGQNEYIDLLSNVTVDLYITINYPLDDMNVSSAVILNNGANNTADMDTFRLRLYQGNIILEPELSINGNRVYAEVTPGTYTIQALYMYSPTTAWYTDYRTVSLTDGKTLSYTLQRAIHIRGGLEYEADGSILSVHGVQMPLIVSNGDDTLLAPFDGWYYDAYLLPDDYTVSLDYTTDDGKRRYVLSEEQIHLDGSVTYLLKDITVKKYRELSGKVIFKGTPVSDVNILFTSIYSGNVYTTTSSETGNYSIMLEVGTYNITVHAPGYQTYPKKYSSKIDLATRASLDIKLNGALVSFTGKVKTSNNLPIPDKFNLRLYEYNDWADMSNFTTINVLNGTISADVEPGRYMAYCSMPTDDGQYLAYMDTVNIKVGTSLVYNIELKPASDFSGTVTYTDFKGKVHYSDLCGELKLYKDDVSMFKLDYNAGVFHYILPYGDYEFSTEYKSVENGMNVTYSLVKDKVHINMTSQSHTFTLEKERTYDLKILYDGPKEINVKPGDVIPIKFRVKNLGNTQDTVTFDDIPPELIHGSKWKMETNPETLKLNILESSTVQVNITVPDLIGPESDYAIKAKSSGGSDVFDVLELKFTTPLQKNFDVTVKGLSTQGVRYGETVEYSLFLQNNGNTETKFNFSATGLSSDWNGSFKYDGYDRNIAGTTLTLGAYDNKTITVSITAPTVEKVLHKSIELKVNVRSNNMTKSVNIKTNIDRPDLEVVGNEVTYENIDLQDGPEFTVKAPVRCNYVSLKSSAYVRLFIDNKLIENKTVESMKQGEEKTVSFQVNATAQNIAGNYHKITVDVVYGEPEKYTDNNEYTDNVFIGLLQPEKATPFNWNLAIFITIIVISSVAAVIVWYKNSI